MLDYDYYKNLESFEMVILNNFNTIINKHVCNTKINYFNMSSFYNG